MVQISMKLYQLINLYNTAKHHREHCDRNCNVSLYALRLIAMELAEKVDKKEMAEAAAIIEDKVWL